MLFADSNTLSGPISGPGGLDFRNGTAVFGGTAGNTYTGTTLVRCSLLELAKPSGVALAVLAGFIALYQGDYFLQSHALMMTVWYLAPHLMWFFLAANLALARVQRRAPRTARLLAAAGTAVLLAGWPRMMPPNGSTKTSGRATCWPAGTWASPVITRTARW